MNLKMGRMLNALIRLVKDKAITVKQVAETIGMTIKEFKTYLPT